MQIKRKYNGKGQVFTSDVVISLIIFLFLASTCFYLWERTYDKSMYFSEQILMKERLFQITDLMVRTPGYPPNWTSKNVKIIGFSSQDHILQKNKIESFINLSDSFIKEKLRIRDYNFFLNISAQNLNFSKGKLWNENSSFILVQTRSILLNDSNKLRQGTLRLYLWK